MVYAIHFCDGVHVYHLFVYCFNMHLLSASFVLGNELSTGLHSPSLKELVFWWQAEKQTESQPCVFWVHRGGLHSLAFRGQRGLGRANDGRVLKDEQELAKRGREFQVGWKLVQRDRWNL